MTSTPVLLLHPLGVDGRVWAELSSLISAPTYAPDLVGHGRHGGAGTGSITEMTDALAETLADEERVFDVIGMSLGGLVGHDLAVRYPQFVRTVTIADAVAVYPEPAREIFRARAQSVRAHGLHSVVDATLATWYSEDAVERSAPIVELTRALLNDGHPDGYTSTCSLLTHVDLSDVGRVRCPVLAVTGEQDAPHFIAAAQRWAHSPDAMVATMPGRHAAILENPDRFVEIWSGWIASRA